MLRRNEYNIIHEKYKKKTTINMCIFPIRTSWNVNVKFHVNKYTKGRILSLMYFAYFKTDAQQMLNINTPVLVSQLGPVYPWRHSQCTWLAIDTQRCHCYILEDDTDYNLKELDNVTISASFHVQNKGVNWSLLQEHTLV